MSISEESSLNPSSETITRDNHNRHQNDRGSSRFDLLSKLIRQDLDLMSTTNVSSRALKHGIDDLLGQINEARTMFNQIETQKENQSSSSSADVDQTHQKKQLERDLQILMKKVSKLKSIFPFSLVTKPPPSNSHINWRDRSTPHSVSAPDKLMQNLPTSSHTPTFQELNASVRGLKNRSRICLICFLVFPENAIIKKSLLVCWAKANEIDFLNEPIDDLIENGLIHPVYKDTLTVGGFWMHPFVRSNLIDQNWLQISGINRWVYVADSASEDDIIYYDPAQFLANKELRMLHMGNWQRTSVRHVEVEDPDLFFKDMAHLTKLRYVSLRGISLVTEIPKFITKIENLEILDLKACHNLEVFPTDIGNLWCSLTHLDVSECYFLEHIPKALSRLRKLRVLKGFVIGENETENSCTLDDLLALEDLMKLSIYTSDTTFPEIEQLITLAKFKLLRSLTVSWGKSRDFIATNVTEQESMGRQGQREVVMRQIRAHAQVIRAAYIFTAAAHISFNLEKLDLQCVPETVTPDWLNPTYFKHLKNLYIRGGQFSNLGQQTEKYPWNVEILRLKHLSNLAMDHSQLVQLFPKLICLETVECPKFANFPSVDSVWKDTTILPPPTTYH